MINPPAGENIDSVLLTRWRAILRDTVDRSPPTPPPITRSTSPRDAALVVLNHLNASLAPDAHSRRGNAPDSSGVRTTEEPAALPRRENAIETLPPIPAPASTGAAVVRAVWDAYGRASAGNEAAAVALDRVAASLAPTALVATADDNPEPWWASELMILHALRSHVWRRPRAASEAGLARCVAFHLAEIQPDHATNEPWAIHAFAATPSGQLTAETLLHAAMVQGGGVLTAAAKLIVIDALAAIELRLGGFAGTA